MSTTKKEYRVKSWANAEESAGEVNSGEIVTTPDMAMSIPELMHRFSAGRTLPALEMEYTEDMEDVRFFDDLEDRRALREANKERIEVLRAEIAEKDKARKEAIRARQKRIQSLLDAEDANIIENDNTSKAKDDKGGKS